VHSRTCSVAQLNVQFLDKSSICVPFREQSSQAAGVGGVSAAASDSTVPTGAVLHRVPATPTKEAAVVSCVFESGEVVVRSPLVVFARWRDNTQPGAGMDRRIADMTYIQATDGA